MNASNRARRTHHGSSRTIEGLATRTTMMKELLLRLIKSCGVFTISRRATRRQLRILAYHGLWTTPGYQHGDRLFMPPELFEERMRWLKNSGYPVLPLNEAVDHLIAGTLPDNAVAITIDDGWSSTYSHMLPVLEQLELPATLYVSTWYCEHQLPVINVAVDYLLARTGNDRSRVKAITHEINALTSYDARVEELRALATRLGATIDEWWDTRQFHMMTGEELRDARRRGLDIQLHTHRHRSVDNHISSLALELEDNRIALGRLLADPGLRFEHFCYPSGGYDPQADAILSKNSIRSATLIDQGINAPGVNPYRLRRFLDGRNASQMDFEAYLSGLLEIHDRIRSRATRTPTHDPTHS